ncbi:Cryptochrome-1 [Stylophora pistillata]|uniref:Cryptochrome-1 n=1 Tax=Stylophora pistillata TaxID=50429 RepID=A0A2B4S449_STYPI|nr:Cryptochrome-1 [Stylophora pistillata]
MAEKEKHRKALHWFRKNLRLHDNPALREALNGSSEVLAVYILPPHIPTNGKISANQWNFLMECLEDLDRGLRCFGCQLLVVQGYPVQVIPKLLSNLEVSKLTFETENEPFGKQRDAVITHMAESAGVEVISCSSHSLYDIEHFLKANGNKVPLLFNDFLDIISTIGQPELPVKTPNEESFSTLRNSENKLFIDYHIPTLEDLGINKSEVTCRRIWHGGETEALKKLEDLLKEMMNTDFQMEPNSETLFHNSEDKLCPFLRFGCLSPRTLYHAISNTYQKAKQCNPPLSLFSFLLWRDFYFLIGSKNPTFHQMENNPLCLQIEWEDNGFAVEQWKEGQTGFPFIDAVMRQLRLEGWIPDVAAQVVGYFLTRGCMWINWQEGFKVFGEIQLDAEWSINAGKWLSISGSAFDRMKPLKFICPVDSGRKIDPSGEYIRKYVPELRHLPTKYLFEPWKTPKPVQQAAGCIIGKNYPLPLVDHKEQLRKCEKRLMELAHNMSTESPAKQSKISANRWNFLLEKQSKISANRWNFLLESLRDLDNQLERLGSHLFVVRGRDVEVLPELFSMWGVTRVSFETDCEPFGAQKDAVLRHIAEKSGIEVISETSHTLFEPSQIIRANQGNISMLFKEFVTVIEENKLSVPSPVKEVNRQLLGSCVTPVAVDHQREYGVPELNELGVKDIRCVTSAEFWRGGEQEALRRLGLLEKELVKNDFEEVPLSAASMSSSQTRLSPYLRFGCLSPRLMWERFTDCYVKGTTGFPWIDAVMRQLRTEGWIPHMARQAVGCFLTRGCLWINWEEGFKVFEELQLDAEWSLNVGNWLWLSGSTFVEEHVPWFCPVEVGKKIDPTGEYVRRHISELKRLPLQYLFEPWKAPLVVQKAARCVVGDDYPEPIANHIDQRKICVRRLKDVCNSLNLLEPISLHWFRKDLRLHDNPSLRDCLVGSAVFYGVYVLDSCEEEKSSPNRWRLLLESLKDLDASLAEFGSRLFVLKGRPTDILPSLFKQWGITRLSFEVDCEPNCKTRDEALTAVAEKAGIQVISHVSHTLYDTEALLKSPDAQAPLLFEDFKKLVMQFGRPPEPVPRVDRELFGSCVTPVGRDHETRYAVPALDIQNLPFIGSGFYQGGEREALSRMEAALCEMIKNDFCEPSLTVRSLMPSPCHLSPYLRLGCLSSRLLYQKMTEEYIKRKAMSPSFDLFNKLLWREFFFVVGSQVSDVHEMISNPLNVQTPLEENPEHFEKWKQGMTGFPWIDAIMRQLRSEGWIHDIARRAIVSFLTRSCLRINWREGFKVFEELQLDSERSLNAGHWLWLSGSTFVEEQVPWFCPVKVGKKIDPSGGYVRKYVPEVRNIPTDFVFEPWLAPCELQESCGCVIDRDYPAPIVNPLE